MVATGTLGIVSVTVMIGIAYSNTDLPTDQQVQDQAVAQESVIYYADKTVLARLGTKRQPVKLSQVPEHVRDAVIGAENTTFRQDVGISIRGLSRAVYNMATGGQVQGGSTITQQLARNYYDGLSQQQTIQRKIKEIFISIKLDQEKSKDKILELYLNTISFGRNTYGIAAAAREFFNQPDVSKLTVAQGAYLAGRIQNPTGFDAAESRGDFGPTKARFEYALGRMKEVDPKYADLEGKVAFPKVRVPKKTKDLLGGYNGYMIQHVLEELKARGISEEEVKSQGYKIYTSFDKKLMHAAKEAVEKNIAPYGKGVYAGLAAINHANGRVVAFYSGKDYLKDFNNRAFDAEKQAASAFKPYVLAAWLQEGYSLKSNLQGNSPYKAPGTETINNAGGKSWGVINAIKAMEQSVNSAFVQMGEKLGTEKVRALAAAAGLNDMRLEYAQRRHSFAMMIGTALVTPVRQAAGYSVFANGGKYFKPHAVIRVVDKFGRNKLTESTTPQQVISPETAADVTAALETVVKTGTGTAARLPNHPAAGKTGTNNGSKEAWFVGYTPQFSAAVGMYKEQKVKGKDGKTTVKEVLLPGNIGGGTVPTRVWHDFMAVAMEGKEPGEFPPPANAGEPLDLETPPPPTPTPSVPAPDQPWPSDGGPTAPPTECSWPDDCDGQNNPGEPGNPNPDLPEPGNPGDPGNPGNPENPADEVRGKRVIPVPTPRPSGQEARRAG
ncbi:transglycosylase domain-containing protein [Rhizohabitans arisaemae]|uniref:transglycosylase domain-containing protein n=1 Tax=Rhizohabitans arisaemae TaxID=2720610 RepID=UPI0024B20E8C|nr:transglycosylase domain-containing protein [Rhizohabitans arisaemae]